jgi:hypothetical protein
VLCKPGILNCSLNFELFTIESANNQDLIRIDACGNNDCSVKGCYSSILNNLNYLNSNYSAQWGLVPTIDPNNQLTNKDLKVIYPGATLTACMNEPLLREYLRDLVCCSLENFKNDFSSLKFNCGFLRGKKYSRRDVFRLLQWRQNPNAQNVGGYVVSSDKRQCPIFVNYHKDDSISATTKYEDHFVNTSTLVYMSKSRRSLQSPDVEAIRNQATNGLRIPIFVKKSNDEGLSFYYLGEGKSESSQFFESTMPVEQGKSVSVVKMVFTLDMPVEEGLYRYLTRVPI